MAIRKLSPLLISQIAAGEVIERPASVVKELAENSLDAGATRLEIAITDGGREMIRISDDGDGIVADELPLAVTAHATSKITEPSELASIGSMGFRGEALASIASVSRVRITSRRRDDDAAATIDASGDTISQVRPASGSPGTVIEVRDLFFNTPARRKFMRAAPTEFGYIRDLVQRLAMAHRDVRFLLTHNERKVLDLPPHDEARRRCAAILGNDLDDALLEFEHRDPPERGGAAIWGLAGLPSIARATSKFQYVYLNGRPIKDRGLMHAIKEAYRGLMPPDRFPVAVIFLDIDPHAFDVNVHPAKTEVRFYEPSRLHGLVLSSLRQRLLGADLTPTMAMPSGGGGRFGASYGSNQSGETADPAIQSPGAFVDYFKRMDPSNKGFVFDQVRKAMDDAGQLDDTPLLLNESNNATNNASGSPSDSEAHADSITSGTTSTVMPPALQPTPILQVHKSYLVTQDEQGMVIIDQHALHERVMFEQLRERVIGQNKTLESQRLLMPAMFDAGGDPSGTLEELQPLLEKIGIEAEPAGPTTIAIHAFPSFLFERRVEPIAFMTELIDRAESGAFDLTNTRAQEAALHEVLDMMACKAAVKAGDRLQGEELAALLAMRETIERSSNCPHGRPTTIRLTLHDLEKQFGRV